jgi:hypothetical protein
MDARVIHFGPDDCHRVMVLRSAGYSIADCRSMVQLRDCLDGGATADALLTSDAEDFQPQEAIALAKTHVSLPVILFRTTTLSYEESGVDLVVHCLTPPEVWLNEVDALIEKSRAMRARSQVFAGKSAQLRRESALAVLQSRAGQEWFRKEIARPLPTHPSTSEPIPPGSEQTLPGAERIPSKERSK